jgi:hypothetical protein
MIISTKEKVIALVVVVLSALFCMLFGCVSFQCAPNRADFACEECYVTAYMIHKNQKNLDKSIVVPLVEACRDTMKEKRRIERLEYCTNKRPADMTFRECISWMNEK